MIRAIWEKYKTTRLIREAIDTYPDGICFAAEGGRPILVNRKMNEICFQLTGHTIINTDAMWKSLSEQKIEDVYPRGQDVPSDKTEHILCSLPDRSVWQFQRRILTLNDSRIMQYEASDITEIYLYQRRLLDNNMRVASLHDRQRALLRNIVMNNEKRELLNAKVRIHDRFGQLLIMTKHALMDDPVSYDRPGLFQAWGDMAADLKNASFRQISDTASPENELLQMAELIGCQVVFDGQQPSERNATLLLYAAIREALTNAVRHADATLLTVEIREAGDHYHIRIMSNGKSDTDSIREGGGLGTLRKRLEQDGAVMEIETNQGVVLVLTIPKE